MNPRNRSRPFVLAAGLLFSAMAPGAESGLDASIAIDYSDNVPNAIEAADRKSDVAAVVGLAATLYHPISENTSFGAGLVAQTQSYVRFSGLSSVAVGTRAQFRHKFGLGPHTPWASIVMRAMHRDYRYDYRDGWQYDATVSSGVRVAQRWELGGSVQYDRYEADDLQPAVLAGVSSAAYDVAGWTFGAHVALLLTESDTVSIAVARRHGSVTAVTRPDFEILEYSSAVARDPVFGSNPIAYRIITDSDTASIHWSRALGRHASINLGYAYRRSQGDEDLEAYTANMVGLSLSYSR